MDLPTAVRLSLRAQHWDKDQFIPANTPTRYFQNTRARIQSHPKASARVQRRGSSFACLYDLNLCLGLTSLCSCLGDKGEQAGLARATPGSPTGGGGGRAEVWGRRRAVPPPPRVRAGLGAVRAVSGATPALGPRCTQTRGPAGAALSRPETQPRPQPCPGPRVTTFNRTHDEQRGGTARPAPSCRGGPESSSGLLKVAQQGLQSPFQT